MSFTSGPISESEQAGEKLADHIGDRAPGVAGSLLGEVVKILRENQIVIRISLEPKS